MNASHNAPPPQTPKDLFENSSPLGTAPPAIASRSRSAIPLFLLSLTTLAAVGGFGLLYSEGRFDGSQGTQGPPRPAAPAIAQKAPPPIASQEIEVPPSAVAVVGKGQGKAEALQAEIDALLAQADQLDATLNRLQASIIQPEEAIGSVGESAAADEEVAAPSEATASLPPEAVDAGTARPTRGPEDPAPAPPQGSDSAPPDPAGKPPVEAPEQLLAMAAGILNGLDQDIGKQGSAPVLRAVNAEPLPPLPPRAAVAQLALPREDGKVDGQDDGQTVPGSGKAVDASPGQGEATASSPPAAVSDSTDQSDPVGAAGVPEGLRPPTAAEPAQQVNLEEASALPAVAGPAEAALEPVPEESAGITAPLELTQAAATEPAEGGEAAARVALASEGAEVAAQATEESSPADAASEVSSAVIVAPPEPAETAAAQPADNGGTTAFAAPAAEDAAAPAGLVGRVAEEVVPQETAAALPAAGDTAPADEAIGTVIAEAASSEGAQPATPPSGDAALNDEAPPIAAAQENAGGSAAPAPSLPAISPEARAELLRRAEEQLALGDVAAARLLYRDAAQAGSQPAAIALGRTYEADFLRGIGAEGVAPDPLLAMVWARRAAAMAAEEPPLPAMAPAERAISPPSPARPSASAAPAGSAAPAPASLSPAAEAAAPVPAPGPAAPAPAASAATELSRLSPPSTVVAPDVAPALPAAPIRPAAPAVAPAQPEPPRSRRAMAPELEAVIRRADEMLALRDISAARLLYTYAAEGGSGHAAAALGRTYDPDFLRGMGVQGIRPDAALAAQWYRRAIALGEGQAAEPLSRLERR